jgi:predicted DNA-binding transcriptional regulator AlpA
MTIPGTFHIDRRAGKILAEFAATDPDELLSTDQVAELLGVSSQWVTIGRSKGYGPPYIVIGPRRIRYRRSSLAAFLNERAFQNTSEYAHGVTSGARKVGDKVVDGKVVRGDASRMIFRTE